jgi:hypothetical protein
MRHRRPQCGIAAHMRHRRPQCGIAAHNAASPLRTLRGIAAHNAASPLHLIYFAGILALKIQHKLSTNLRGSQQYRSINWLGDGMSHGMRMRA